MHESSQREVKQYSGEVKDSVSESFFPVSILYFTDPELSIESYELEEDEISREELVQMFGSNQIKRLEEELT